MRVFVTFPLKSIHCGAIQRHSRCRGSELPTDSSVAREEKINEYNREFLNPNLAAKAGNVDEIIDPVDTRQRMFDALRMLSTKRPSDMVAKRHANMPL